MFHPCGILDCSVAWNGPICSRRRRIDAGRKSTSWRFYVYVRSVAKRGNGSLNLLFRRLLNLVFFEWLMLPGVERFLFRGASPRICQTSRWLKFEVAGWSRINFRIMRRTESEVLKGMLMGWWWKAREFGIWAVDTERRTSEEILAIFMFQEHREWSCWTVSILLENKMCRSARHH